MPPTAAYRLPPTAAYCRLLPPTAAYCRYCCLLRPTAAYCRLLLPTAAYCRVLPPTTAYCAYCRLLRRLLAPSRLLPPTAPTAAYCAAYWRLAAYCRLLPPTTAYCRLLPPTAYCPYWRLLLPIAAYCHLLPPTAAYCLLLTGEKQSLRSGRSFSPSALSQCSSPPCWLAHELFGSQRNFCSRILPQHCSTMEYAQKHANSVSWCSKLFQATASKTSHSFYQPQSLYSERSGGLTE